MTIDGGAVIVLLYLLVSAGVIVAFVLIFAGGLEWFVDRLRERHHRQAARPLRDVLLSEA